MRLSSDPEPAAANAKWLAVVGIGEDGVEGLGAAARQAVAGAHVVFGGRRHLALAAPLIRGAARPWPTPFDAAMAEVLALRGRAVCVLASGDPFQNGVGATLARRIDIREMAVFPGPSAFSLAAARLGWALQEVEAVSLHGREVALLRPLLHPGARILALTSDGGSPAEVARLLVGDGFGRSSVHVLEALGGGAERIRSAPAAAFAAAAFAGADCGPLNLVAIEVAADPGARVLPLGGLDDGLFEHDGQITKREVRAVTLAALAPRRGERLWDIGAGAGSVGIEWMLRHPSLRAVAVEADRDRAARIRRNAAALGVPGLQVVDGAAPAALAGLPPPDAIFLGGGGTDPGVLDAALTALAPGGRMVANAVTLEMQALLAATAARLGGALTTIAIARAAPVGGMTAWRPAMPVTQWAWAKPCPGEAATVAGLGCRRGVTAAEVLAAVDAARAAHGGPVLGALATVPAKRDEPALADAADRLGLPLLVVEPAGDDRLRTRSAASRAATGAGSASEAAALAAAGPGARLLGPRLVVGRVTCALAARPAP